MNLNAMVERVMQETARPDQEQLVRRMVRMAIKEIHNLGLFPRDLVEDTVFLQEPSHKFKINLPARLRVFGSIMPTNRNGAILRTVTEDGRLEPVSPEHIVDIMRLGKTDVYYISGASVVVVSSSKAEGLYMSWYENPDISDNHLETWLMGLEPDTFVESAKAKVYKQLGREKIAADIRNELYQVSYEYILQNYSTSGLM